MRASTFCLFLVLASTAFGQDAEPVEAESSPDSTEAAEPADTEASGSVEAGDSEPAGDTETESPEPVEAENSEPEGDTETEDSEAEDGGDTESEDSEPAETDDSGSEDTGDSDGSGTETSQSTAAAESPAVPASSELSSLVKNLGTAQGQIAMGLEVVNGNVATLTGQVNDYAQVADEELDAALVMTTQATSILVNSQVIELQEELRETLTQIDEIRARINDSTQVCQGLLSCDDCSRDSACVWCRSERSCVAGDRNGPLGGECSVYFYGTCGGGCGEHSQCAACIGDNRCGWCTNGGVCMDKENSDCAADFWLVRDSTVGNSCPGSPSATSSYQSFNPNAYIDTQLSRLQRDLRENMDRAAALRQQIDGVEQEMADIMEQFNSISQQDIEDVESTNTLVGLSGIVDETSRRDRKCYSEDELLERTREIAQEVGQRVSADTVAAVEASNQQRIAQEEQFMETIRSMTQTMAEQSAAQQTELSNQQRINDELQTQAAQADQQAAQAEKQADQPAEAPAEGSSFLQEMIRYRSFLRSNAK